jgi:hypothetical protein
MAYKLVPRRQYTFAEFIDPRGYSFQLGHVARSRREVSIADQKGDGEVALPHSQFGISQLAYLQDKMLDKHVVQVAKEFVRSVLQKLAL